jgi:ATP-dependent DNA ligase
MLARAASAPPAGDGWPFEPKMDGDRCMVDTHDGFRARSRRGWAMADLVPELEQLPPDLMLDGELLSFDAESSRRPRECSTTAKTTAGHSRLMASLRTASKRASAPSPVAEITGHCC